MNELQVNAPPHDEQIWDIDKAPTLPRHPNCRCVLVAYFDVDKVAEEFERKEANLLNNPNSDRYSKIATGASGAKNYFRDDSLDFIKDSEDIRKEKHAYNEYDRIKNSNQKHEIDKIYNKIKHIDGMKDFTREDVEIVFNHVFNNEHDLDDGIGLFKPDYDMAQSWNRLINSNEIQDHDIVLLQHERLEHDYIYKDGLDYYTAHDKVSEKYLYKPPKEDK